MDNEENKKLAKILYYRIGRDDEMWFYSSTNNIDGKEVFEYHILTLIENVPEIEDLDSPREMLKNIQMKPTVINEGSLDYIRFIAIKDVAEKNILIKMQKEGKTL